MPVRDQNRIFFPFHEIDYTPISFINRIFFPFLHKTRQSIILVIDYMSNQYFIEWCMSINILLDLR